MQNTRRICKRSWGWIVAVDEMGRASTIASVSFLRPGEVVFGEMLSGWRNQQLSRNLQFGTVDSASGLYVDCSRRSTSTRGTGFPATLISSSRHLRAERHASKSTIRSYQGAVRMFCDYVSSPEYGWPDVCERMFGTSPVQVCHDWNTARHAQERRRVPASEPSPRRSSRRSLTEQMRSQPELPRRRARAGSQHFETPWYSRPRYAWGLRRNEVCHLQTVDFSRNPKAREFGRYGVLYVRHGKAMRELAAEAAKRPDRLRLGAGGC